MRDDRVITLPVFKTMVVPVAQKAWKCSLCKDPVKVGERYTHYINRKPHEIINYRFHNECFAMVTAYCAETKKTTFTPKTVANWVSKKFCEVCGKGECKPRECPKILVAIKFLKKRK